MDLNGLIRALEPSLAGTPLKQLEAAWTPRFVRKGEVLARQGDQVTQEIMVLDGRIVSQICDADGRGVAVAFCVGPGFVSPHIARTRDSTSLVTLAVTEVATIAEMRADRLLATMLQSPDIRDWATACYVVTCRERPIARGASQPSVLRIGWLDSRVATRDMKTCSPIPDRQLPWDDPCDTQPAAEGELVLEAAVSSSRSIGQLWADSVEKLPCLRFASKIWNFVLSDSRSANLVCDGDFAGRCSINPTLSGGTPTFSTQSARTGSLLR